jgi:hypothetical protein
MITQTAQNELIEYFTKLSSAEQDSFLSLIKTVIANKEAIGIKQYNDELEKADAEIEAGEFMLHEDVQKLLR